MKRLNPRSLSLADVERTLTEELDGSDFLFCCDWKFYCEINLSCGGGGGCSVGASPDNEVTPCVVGDTM